MQPNQQPTAPLARDPQSIQLHHVFATIQGEGPYAGRPAIFVRLAGCNLQCPACDTDYTSHCEVVSPAELVERIIPLQQPFFYNRRLVVITGGEPMRQDISVLVTMLHRMGYDVQIETNGTLSVPQNWPHHAATIVCSPKTPAINRQMELVAQAYKYILSHDAVDPQDGLPTITMGAHRPARPPLNYRGEVYVQPLDTVDGHKNYLNQQAAVRSCIRFGYRLSLQTHKILNLE